MPDRKRPVSTPMLSEMAPPFAVPDQDGKIVSLSDFKNQTVFVYFYPKDDTPGCTQEACDFRDSFSRLQKKGVVILGVSRDSEKKHQKFREKFSLPFPLLSDVSGKMTEDYGVWIEKSMYGKKYMGIDRTTLRIYVNAKGAGTIERKYPKVKVPGHVEQLLKDANEDGRL